MLLTFHSVLRKLYTEPSIGAFYQCLVHLTTLFQRRRVYRNRPIRCKNWLFLFTAGDELSNFYRRPYTDASYQVSVYLAKRFQRRRFVRKRLITNKNCLWWPCLLRVTVRDKLNDLYRTSHRCFLPSFGSFKQAISEENIYFYKLANQK